MKIVSFPHYTCGGLLCDILNNTWSPVSSTGGISNIQHHIGKIGDSPDVFLEFDPAVFYKSLSDHNTNQWIGTHCWLGHINLDDFTQIINVTTETYRSRLYRWVRAYHLYYPNTESWQNRSGMEQIDKQRETAKNYLKPFSKINHVKVINLEFCDVVEQRPIFLGLAGGDYQRHLDRWKKINSFLYAPNLWSSTAAERFHEAEHECCLGQYYIYE